MKSWIPTAILCALCTSHAFAEAAPPNILLFLVDDMGLMDTSVPMLTDEQGRPKRHPLNDWYRTPNMERLAARGVRFSNFYAHNVCSPTRVSILTGQNAARHRTTDWINPYQNNRDMDKKRFPRAITRRVPPTWNWEGLGKGDVTLPAILKERGYTTIHIGKAHFGPDRHAGAEPRNLGFDVNVGGSAIGHPKSYYGRDRYGKGSLQAVPHLEKYHGTDTFLTEALTLEAKAQLDKALEAGKPFFLYMSHYAVHAPFNSDPRFADHYTGKGKPAQAYATLVEGIDKSLGDLMDHLEEKGIAEDTLILFLGDNGGDAPLGELDGIASSAPLRGRKGGKWEGGVRVPFIAAWAKRDADNSWQKKLPIVAGAIRPEIGGCYDLFPTIADLVGAPIPDGHPVDGQVLSRLLCGKQAPDHRNEFLNHYPHPRRGQSHFFTTWRRGDWKVIYEYFKEGGQRCALYDLAGDPGESRNLAAEKPEQLKRMMRGMVEALEAMGAVYPVEDGRTIRPPAMATTPEADAPGPFVVHLNCGEGKRTAELLERRDTIVQGLDTSRENVEKARINPVFDRDYGRRITFRWFDGENLPYIDNSVNRIIGADRSQVPREEIMRVLVPGGTAIIDGKKTAKPWPPDIDEWTHHLHGPDNNRVSRDTRLAPPLSHLQWTAGPRFTRHHEHMSSFQAMVSAGGRIFYIVDAGSRESVLLPPDWNLVARDAFNGVELWRKKLDHWFNHLWPFKSGPVVVTRRLVANGDRLYAALRIGGGISVLDAKTGAILHELPGTEGAEEIIVDGGRLFVVTRQWLVEADTCNVKNRITSGGAAARMTRNLDWNDAGGLQHVAAFDPATSRLLWRKKMPVAPFGLGSRDGHVYLFDGERVLSLQADSGRSNWTSKPLGKARFQFSSAVGCNLVCGRKRILLGGAAGQDMVALSAQDGSVLWKAPQYASGRHSAKDLFLIDRTAWTANTLPSSMTLPGVPSSAKRKSGRVTGYSLNDGTIVADFYAGSDVYMMNSRCHMSCATANYFITSRTGAELVSVREKTWHLHHWLRGACLYGLMPANGMLYAPPNPCACYMQSSLDGFNAVTGHQAGWQPLVEKRRTRDFVLGAAPPEKLPADMESNAWPVYRRDNRRSGSTDAEVGLPLAVAWRAEGYDDLTSLVVAGGRCVFAEKDRHAVHCLDVETGKPQWTHVAGGRIDSPPAISGDRLFFGCADGWLYRLALSTGKLAWKRRIAPADLTLFDHGQPASVWPLSGSVLVRDGRIYCVAGRSLFLDGGIHLTVVDAESGEVLHRNVLDSHDPLTGGDMHRHVAMQNMPVALPDLLSSDGTHLYMRTQQFDLRGKRTHIKNSAWDDTIRMGVGREHLFAATGFLDDNGFHRSYWVYGNSFLGGGSMPSGGWFEMGRISPSGKMLCCDETTVYGYGQFPEYSKWSTPLRYTLFSMSKTPKRYQPGIPDAELRKNPRMNWRKYRTLRCPKVEFDFHWKHAVPVRVKAIVKTPDVLFLAGPEDVLDEEEVFEDSRSEANRKRLQKQNELIHSQQGGKLRAVSVKDGTALQAVNLQSPPVWDGMAAAYGTLFMCCRDGSVVAFRAGN